MKASSTPKVPFLRRTYVRRDTAAIERPRKMHDMMIMVKGRPSGAIILASGSTFGFSIGVYYLGKLTMDKHTTSENRRNTAEGSTLYCGSEYAPSKRVDVLVSIVAPPASCFVYAESFSAEALGSGVAEDPRKVPRNVRRPNSFKGIP